MPIVKEVIKLELLEFAKSNQSLSPEEALDKFADKMSDIIIGAIQSADIVLPVAARS